MSEIMFYREGDSNKSVHSSARYAIQDWHSFFDDDGDNDSDEDDESKVDIYWVL